MIFESVFKVNPFEAGTAATRTVLLKVVPSGTSANEARATYAELGSGTEGGALSCASDRETIRCDYELSESAFGIVRRGVRFEFRLDGQERVADVTTKLTTHVFGGEV
jgi:hypothetical protein